MLWGPNQRGLTEAKLTSQLPETLPPRFNIYSTKLQAHCAPIAPPGLLSTLHGPIAWAVPPLQVRLVVLMMSPKGEREAPLLCCFTKLKVSVFKLHKEYYNVTSKREGTDVKS